MPALLNNRVLYRDGVAIATLSGGEITWLEDLEPADARCSRKRAGETPGRITAACVSALRPDRRSQGPRARARSPALRRCTESRCRASVPSRRIECNSRVVSTAPVAPIGWPCAIAPPSTLTMSSGRPSSRRTASGTAANASLISTRSTSREVPASALQRLPDRGHGTDAEHAGLDRRDAVSDEARDRLQAIAARRTSRSGDDHRRRTAVEPGRVAGRDRAVLAKRRLQLGEHLQRRLRPIRLVGVEASADLFALDFDADDLRREAAALSARRRNAAASARPSDPGLRA